MKILLIGCVESTYRFLETLINDNADVVGVITKSSSSFNADFVDLTPLCQKHNIPYIYVTNTNEEAAVNFIKEKNPDIGYCLGWSSLISDHVIDLFPMGMVGFHPAALPNNRGRHPIIWALALGLEKTASTFFMIDKTADTGDIISSVPVYISYNDTAETLMKKILDTACIQLSTLTEELKEGKTKPVSQKHSAGNSWRKRGRIDGQIDWRMSSKAIYDLVRALTHPYVGAHFMMDDKEIKVWAVREIIDDSHKNIEPGKVMAVSDHSFTVKVWDNCIEVTDCDPISLNVGDYL